MFFLTAGHKHINTEGQVFDIPCWKKHVKICNTQMLFKRTEIKEQKVTFKDHG